MLGGALVGPGQRHAPIGQLAVRGPHLLTGHDPSGVLSAHPGLDTGQIRSRSRLAEELTPVLAPVGGSAESSGSIGKLLGSRATARARDLGLAMLGPRGMLWAQDRSLAGALVELCLFSPAVSI
jgi:hypothetical protein